MLLLLSLATNVIVINDVSVHKFKNTIWIWRLILSGTSTFQIRSLWSSFVTVNGYVSIGKEIIGILMLLPIVSTLVHNHSGVIQIVVNGSACVVVTHATCTSIYIGVLGSVHWFP